MQTCQVALLLAWAVLVAAAAVEALEVVHMCLRMQYYAGLASAGWIVGSSSLKGTWGFYAVQERC